MSGNNRSTQGRGKGGLGGRRGRRARPTKVPNGMAIPRQNLSYQRKTATAGAP